MTQRIRVYAEDGTPFDVPEHKVSDLVLNRGFTQSRPEMVTPEPTPAAEVFYDADADDDVFANFDETDDEDLAEGDEPEADDHAEGDEPEASQEA